MDANVMLYREHDDDLSDFAKRDDKIMRNYTQKDFDAEFEKFKKEFAEKHKNDESISK